MNGSPMLRRACWLAAGLFLVCGALLASAIVVLSGGLPPRWAAPATAVGFLVASAWLGIGAASAVLALTWGARRGAAEGGERPARGLALSYGEGRG